MRTVVTLILTLCTTLAAASPPPSGLDELMGRWAEASYQTPKGEREQALKALTDEAHRLSEAQPGQAGPLIWEAIILSSYAGASGGLGALSLVEQARELLLQAETIDPDALDGSIYTTLGSLYYQVPGWPLAFGDDDQARGYLQRAIAISPDGIDANYFYGDFLLDQGEHEEAIRVLNHALLAPPRPGREVADRGRQGEVREALARARSMAATH